MTHEIQRLSAALALGILLLPAHGPALERKREAQIFTLGIGPSTGQVAGIAAGIAAAGAAIGIGVYFAIRHDHRVTGCARSGPDGMQLTSETDKQTFTLTGEIAGIKPGDRIQVSGKKEKSAAGPKFLVEKVSKDFGPCEAASSSR